MAVNRTMSLIFLVIFGVFSLTGCDSQLTQLDEANWQQMLTGEWMVEFFAPWCPACKSLQPAWKQLGVWSKGRDGFYVGQVDVTQSPGLSGRFIVTVLPTIFHVKDGLFRQYKGSRDYDSLVQFIAERKWREVEPVPAWKSPDSPQMSALSAFFKLSQFLRGLHTKLMDEFNLPSWASYLIFAVATIFLGSFLGLALVCFIDLVYPSQKKRTPVDPKANVIKDDKSDSENLPDDEIKDDLLDDVSQNASETETDRYGKTSSTNASPAGSPNVKKRKIRKAD